MGRSLGKIKCPNPEHEDATPSCSVYEDGSGYCFGCSTRFPKVSAPEMQRVIKPAEDLKASLARIQALPKLSYRGLEFPYDTEGYYIVWPDHSYYKCRRWTSLDSRGKYRGPGGHAKPAFLLPAVEPSRTLFIVEGEINAMSLKTLGLHADILSPGGVGDFTSSRMRATLRTLVKYESIYILVDNEPVSFMAAITLKHLLTPHIADIAIHLLDEDANELLVKNNGPETLKAHIQALALPGRVPHYTNPLPAP